MWYVLFTKLFFYTIYLNRPVNGRGAYNSLQNLRGQSSNVYRMNSMHDPQINPDSAFDNIGLHYDPKLLSDSYSRKENILFRPVNNKDSISRKKRGTMPVMDKFDEKLNIDDNTVGIVIDPRTRKAVGVLENTMDTGWMNNEINNYYSEQRSLNLLGRSPVLNRLNPYYEKENQLNAKNLYHSNNHLSVDTVRKNSDAEFKNTDSNIDNSRNFDNKFTENSFNNEPENKIDNENQIAKLESNGNSQNMDNNENLNENDFNVNEDEFSSVDENVQKREAIDNEDEDMEHNENEVPIKKRFSMSNFNNENNPQLDNGNNGENSLNSQEVGNKPAANEEDKGNIKDDLKDKGNVNGDLKDKGIITAIDSNDRNDDNSDQLNSDNKQNQNIESNKQEIDQNFELKDEMNRNAELKDGMSKTSDSNDEKIAVDEKSLEVKELKRSKRQQSGEKDQSKTGDTPKSGEHKENDEKSVVNDETKTDTSDGLRNKRTNDVKLGEKTSNNKGAVVSRLADEESRAAYEKEIEAQIQAKINAINEQVKREIAVQKLSNVPPAISNNNNVLKNQDIKLQNSKSLREKRRLFPSSGTLLDSENPDINPDLAVDDNALQPYVRKRRNINRYSRYPLVRHKRSNAVVPYQQSAFLLYRAEDDEDNDEGNEFDDDGFDDRTSNLAPTSQQKRQILNPYQKRYNTRERNFGYGPYMKREINYVDPELEQNSYFYDYGAPSAAAVEDTGYSRRKRDTSDVFQRYNGAPAMTSNFHGGGGTALNRAAFRNRNAQNRMPNYNNRYSRSVDDKSGKLTGGGDSTHLNRNNLNRDVFQDLSDGYQNELTRLKRVKRSTR